MCSKNAEWQAANMQPLAMSPSITGMQEGAHNMLSPYGARQTTTGSNNMYVAGQNLESEKNFFEVLLSSASSVHHSVIAFCHPSISSMSSGSIVCPSCHCLSSMRGGFYYFVLQPGEVD
jgi:hypothetical protein